MVERALNEFKIIKMQKILVIQQKMIGDVLVSTILCENLALKFPDAQIDYLVYDTTLPVLEHHSSNFRVIPYTKEHRASKQKMFHLAQQIRREKYDVVIDSYSKLESWVFVALSGAKQKISFDKGYINFLYTDVIKRHEKATSNLGLIIEQRLNLLKPLGILAPTVTKPKLHISAKEIQETQLFLKNHKVDTNRPLVMVSVLGSSDAKTYPLPYMAKVLDDMIAYQPMSLLFNYIPSQRNQALELYSLCSEPTKQYIYIEAIGKSLRDFISLMNACDFIVGNDGGAINMAKALNKPAFTIFSPMIDKEGWNSFEDGKHNISVHLNDYKPELFKNLSPKEVKIKNEPLYLKFHPELFQKQFAHFLSENVK